MSIHLNVPKTPQSLSILPSSLFTLFLSLSLSRCARDLVRSHVRHANVPSFHHFLPRLAHPLPRCSRTLVPLCSLPLFTRRGNGGRRGGRRRKGTKDTVKGVRLRAGGGGGWRRDRLPTEEALSSPLTGKKSEDARNPPLLHHLPFSTPSPRSSTVANKEAGFRRRRDLSTSGTANWKIDLAAPARGWRVEKKKERKGGEREREAKEKGKVVKRGLDEARRGTACYFYADSHRGGFAVIAF